MAKEAGPCYQKLWAILRIALGWIFLWAFLDKVFGLGFTTKPEAAWLAGGSPTTGFLKFATAGPFAGVYQAMAGSFAVDTVFMLGLLFLGVALILGIANRLAGYLGALLMFLMWTAAMPPEHNPIVDDHIINLLALLLVSVVKPGKWWGLGNWWSKTSLVKRYKILE